MPRRTDPVAAATARERLLPPSMQGAVAARRTTVEHHGGHPMAVHRWGDRDAPATLVLVHGGGGNGLLLAPFAVQAIRAGYAAVAPDLPGYGLSRQPGRTRVRYDDWHRVLHDLLVAEGARGPVVVFGASMGGRLAFEAAGTSRVPRWVVATNLLEPTDPSVRRDLTRWSWMGRIPPACMGRPSWPTARIPVPMRLVADMRAIANDDRWRDALVADPSAGGAWMPLGFLRTYLSTPPAVAPEDFDVCPVTLAQPGDDRWTPLRSSLPLFERITRVPTDVVTLEHCGHLPVEEPGRSVLLDVLVDRLGRVAGVRA